MGAVGSVSEEDERCFDSLGESSLLQQRTGLNAIFYYAPTIFQHFGLSDNTTSLLATSVVGIVMLLATIPTLFYIDTLGRNPILTLSATGMGTW